MRITEPEDHLGMTEERRAWFQAHTHGFGEQDENGVDVSLLRENLRLTPTQRIEKMLRCLASAPSDPSVEAQPVLWSLLAAVHRGKVRCTLIGNWAMYCHGAESRTQDVDLYYSRDAGNLQALAEALTPFHPRLRGAISDLPFSWDARALRCGMSFFLATDAADVDLFGAVPGVCSFEAVWERSIEMELLGVPVRVASLDDLVAMKRAAGRPVDKLHLTELERLRALAAEAVRVKNEGE